jgi:hypothetical protein
VGGNNELAELWRWFVANEAVGYSPLYAAIVEAAATDDDLLALVASAPERSQYPLMMLAAIHDLVLAGELPDLAAVYRGERSVDAAPPLFRAAMLDHRDHVSHMLHTRFIQTNECGRAAPLALGLACVVDALGDVGVLIDAGASAGLNLLYDRYCLGVVDGVVWGDPQSPVVCVCATEGRPPAPLRLVDIPVRVGIDRAPIDVTDPIAARWLLACTWPDTGRLERTRAAIEIAATSPPDVRAADLVTGIGPLLAEVGGAGTVCVVTAWAAGYLDLEQRSGFVVALQRAAVEPIAWLSFEHPGTVDGLTVAEGEGWQTSFGIVPSVVGLTIIVPNGVESQRALAHVHPHGGALEWIA